MIENIIGLDPSLISSGMCINGKLFNYATNINNKSGLKKWYALSEEFITYREIEYDKTSNTFTDSEINKLLDYDRVTNMIMKDLVENPELEIEPKYQFLVDKMNEMFQFKPIYYTHNL